MIELNVEVKSSVPFRETEVYFFSDIGHMTVRIASLQGGLEVRDIPQMDFIFFKEIKVLCKEPEE